MKHFKPRARINAANDVQPVRTGSPRERRRTGLRGLAHVIALKLHELCVPYIERDQEPPAEFLARTRWAITF